MGLLWQESRGPLVLLLMGGSHYFLSLVAQLLARNDSLGFAHMAVVVCRERVDLGGWLDETRHRG